MENNITWIKPWEQRKKYLVPELILIFTSLSLLLITTALIEETVDYTQPETLCQAVYGHYMQLSLKSTLQALGIVGMFFAIIGLMYLLGF
jgi:hypothetical protein